MTFEEIRAEWKSDGKLDTSDLEREIPRRRDMLYKYQEFYWYESKALCILQKNQKNLWRMLRKYYKGLCTKEELGELNRPQYAGKVTELIKQIETDEEYTVISAKVKLQESKVEYLKTIINDISYNWNKDVQQYLVHLKWTGGME